MKHVKTWQQQQKLKTASSKSSKNKPDLLDLITEILDKAKDEQRAREDNKASAKFGSKGLGSLKIRKDPVIKELEKKNE